MARILIVFVLCGMGMAPLLTHADDARGADSGPAFYLGANYGYYKARGADFDDDYDLLEGVLGIHFSRYLGIEASVIDFGRIGSPRIEAEVDGWTASAMLRLPVSDTTAIYARGGMLFWDADLRAADDIDEAIDDSDVFYGAGVDFRINRMLRLAVEYVRYEIEFEAGPISVTTDIDAAKVGLRLTF